MGALIPRVAINKVLIERSGLKANVSMVKNIQWIQNKAKKEQSRNKTQRDKWKTRDKVAYLGLTIHSVSAD